MTGAKGNLAGPLWIGVVFASVIWWTIAAQHVLWRFVLIAALSFSSFMVGCAVGFLFTSYGEEAGTIGKIRDWLIGGITGITVANVATIKALLVTFAFGPGPREYALAASAATTYVVLGFFFMFLQRELILNVLLAESRAARSRLEGMTQAGAITQQLLSLLPISILSGTDDIDEISQKRKDEADALKNLLYSEDVNKFLDDAENCLKSGSALDWDVISKAANLHYYRTYFEKDNKSTQVKKAHDWILRALVMNPLHADLTVKFADILGMMSLYREAVTTLRRLEQTPEAPAYVKQWLGYFLLFVPGHEQEAIRYSEEYHNAFPDESDSLFNIACGYAQLYCNELKALGDARKNESEYRTAALRALKRALAEQPEYAETVRTKWTAQGESFDCFADDKEFLQLVAPPEKAATGK